MLRFLFRAILVAIVVLAALLAFGLLASVRPSGQQFVLIKSGSSARRIASDLERAGVIRSQAAFLLWHYFKGHKSLKAGEYAFDRPANAIEVYDRLGRGDIYIRTLVVPEGYNMFDIAAALEVAGLGVRADFLAVAQTETALVRDLDPQAPSLEGYLFPDTYHFSRTQSMHDIASVMVRRFRQEMREISLASDLHNVVTMASIVEKETAVPDERPVVAGVFQNRLEKDTQLKTDPTVIYAALLDSRYRGKIYQSDLQSASPYNTYKVVGLPPGPICNPGRASLLAAMHPAKTDYFFFVSDNQGHHRFARTEQEHAKNVA